VNLAEQAPARHLNHLSSWALINAEAASPDAKSDSIVPVTTPRMMSCAECYELYSKQWR